MRHKTGAISPNRKPSKMKLCCKPEGEVPPTKEIKQKPSSEPPRTAEAVRIPQGCHETGLAARQ